ncbi:hypothetical protein ACJMK2_043082 [Sinanodonta woodiana]|uniref:Uncharacterized protein n=1 Tax=Sinanodonta woodiana TaxID=1069815 RepID=A0ABD3VVV2_SINWO
MGFLTPSPTSKLIIERKLDVVSLIPDEISLIPDEISLVPDEISISPGQTTNSTNNETTRSRNILTPAKIDKTTTTTTTTTSVNNAKSGLEILNESPDHKKPLQFTLKQEIEDLEKFTRSNYAHKEYLERTDLLEIINNATHVNDSKSKKEIDNDVTDIKTCNGSTTTTTTMAIEVITDKDHKATITTPPITTTNIIFNNGTITDQNYNTKRKMQTIDLYLETNRSNDTPLKSDNRPREGSYHQRPHLQPTEEMPDRESKWHIN